MGFRIDSRRARGIWLVFITALALLALYAAPTAALAGGSVYVGNRYSKDVSQYSIGSGGALSPLSPPTVAGGFADGRVVVSPDGKSVYIANTTDSAIWQYDVDPASGRLSPKTPATVTTRSALGLTGPTDIAITPDGKNAYVANGYVSHYTIDPTTGTLSLKSPNLFEAGAFAVAVSPDGKSLYALAGDILMYDIDPASGDLSPKQPFAVLSRTLNARNLGVTPDGRSVYVTNFVCPDPPDCEILAPAVISMYDVSQVSGVLAPKTPPTVVLTGGLGASHIAVTPDGKSAFVTGNDGLVSQYDIDRTTGQLSPKSPPTVAVDPNGVLRDMAVSPDGLSAYVNLVSPTEESIHQYDIDPASGRLSPKTPATVATDLDPRGIAAGPLPRTPTSKQQCRRGGWRNFPQFKNQGQCVAFVQHAG